MSRRSTSTPNLHDKVDDIKPKKPSGISKMVNAPRMMSFAATTEQQFADRLSQGMRDDLRSVPGKGLARKDTLFLEKDELDEEVHVNSKTAPLDSRSASQRVAAAPSSAAAQGLVSGGESTIRLERSGSMTQYDAMFDHLEALKFLEKDDEEDDDGEKDTEKGEKSDDARDVSSTTQQETQTQTQAAQAQVVLEEEEHESVLSAPAVDPTASPATQRKQLEELQESTGSSSNKINIKLSSLSDKKFALDAKTIAICREQSTVRMGNTVLFPLMLMPPPEIKRRFDLACADFKTWKHFTDGSNSHIYKAKCAASVASASRASAARAAGPQALVVGMKVIVKALKDSELQNPIALREFDSERELLASINHENILMFLGSGVDLCDSMKKLGSDGGDGSSSRSAVIARGNSMRSMLAGRAKVYPRPFLVLQRLNGGSLSLLLGQHQQCHTTLPFLRVLEICQQLSQALDYLHNHFHPQAVLIHRDIKPDNIGFDDKGVLKLMDFGISTCIRREVLAKGPYLMTGLTGSLRYMAKEVFLEKPYNQAVDVHSLGIILWHVATCSMPFPRFSRQKFSDEVVGKNLRPPVDEVQRAASRQGGGPAAASPQVAGLVALMERCWAPDFHARPDMSEALRILSALLDEERALHLASCC